MFTDYVLSENDKSDIRLHQTSLIVINSLIIIGKYEVFRWNRGGLIYGIEYKTWIYNLSYNKQKWYSFYII